VDTNAPAATMSKMAAAIPEAEFHTIEPAGHLVNLEAPQQTNAILQSFFNRHIQ
jgi:pimeloyl-ACP methyl ester carboxylesterase